MNFAFYQFLFLFLFCILINHVLLFFHVSFFSSINIENTILCLQMNKKLLLFTIFSRFQSLNLKHVPNHSIQIYQFRWKVHRNIFINIYQPNCRRYMCIHFRATTTCTNQKQIRKHLWYKQRDLDFLYDLVTIFYEEIPNILYQNTWQNSIRLAEWATMSKGKQELILNKSLKPLAISYINVYIVILASLLYHNLKIESECTFFILSYDLRHN